MYNSTFINGRIYVSCMSCILFISNTIFLGSKSGGKQSACVDVFHANVTLHRCKFMNNTGGIGNFYLSSVVLDSTEFLNNRGGGALFTSSDFHITGCLFRNNFARSGGAVYASIRKSKVVNSDASGVINNTIFQENHATMEYGCNILHTKFTNSQLLV